MLRRRQKLKSRRQPTDSRHRSFKQALTKDRRNGWTDCHGTGVANETVPPLADIELLTRSIFNFDDHARACGLDVDVNAIAEIAEQAARFAAGVLEPINHSRDREGSRLADARIVTPGGFQEAYREFVAGGWNGVRFPVRYGGQGVSHVASTILEEMWQAANPGFALCPMLTSSAIAALLGAGSDELKKRYLPKLVAGVWTGSMNLTDHTGSNLGAEESKVIRQTDGSYRIFGQNNFIIYGDHDLAENVIHLVLARSRDGQRGVESVSLFVVPKMLFDEKARVGPKNDVRCVSLKEKLGIHASPTAVMLFGERNGAAAEIVGEEGRGLEYMSLMMDEARFSVGIQGLGMAERAFQRALAYAADRIRGEAFANSGLSTILGDPHVRRLLLSMKSNI